MAQQSGYFAGLTANGQTKSSVEIKMGDVYDSRQNRDHIDDHSHGHDQSQHVHHHNEPHSETYLIQKYKEKQRQKQKQRRRFNRYYHPNSYTPMQSLPESPSVRDSSESDDDDEDQDDDMTESEDNISVLSSAEDVNRFVNEEDDNKQNADHLSSSQNRKRKTSTDSLEVRLKNLSICPLQPPPKKSKPSRSVHRNEQNKDNVVKEDGDYKEEMEQLTDSEMVERPKAKRRSIKRWKSKRRAKRSSPVDHAQHLKDNKPASIDDVNDKKKNKMNQNNTNKRYRDETSSVSKQKRAQRFVVRKTVIISNSKTKNGEQLMGWIEATDNNNILVRFYDEQKRSFIAEWFDSSMLQLVDSENENISKPKNKNHRNYNKKQNADNTPNQMNQIEFKSHKSNRGRRAGIHNILKHKKYATQRPFTGFTTNTRSNPHHLSR